MSKKIIALFVSSVYHNGQRYEVGQQAEISEDDYPLLAPYVEVLEGEALLKQGNDAALTKELEDLRAKLAQSEAEVAELHLQLKDKDAELAKLSENLTACEKKDKGKNKPKPETSSEQANGSEAP